MEVPEVEVVLHSVRHGGGVDEGDGCLRNRIAASMDYNKDGR